MTHLKPNQIAFLIKMRWSKGKGQSDLDHIKRMQDVVKILGDMIDKLHAKKTV